ncbi:MAG: trans-sialidase, partial [Candidatus Nitrosopelagicus sp.]|nr:trans-sialidase [Candidatus Nitrosopelagicus sp.]
SRALVAETNVTPSNWNDHKTKITGFTAPGNKYFATKQRLAYHPEAKKFGTWINDAPASGQAKATPPPPPPPPPQQTSGQTASSGSSGKSKQEQLEDYEKEYLVRLEQQKADQAKAAADEAAAAAAAAQSSKGSMPKGWTP